jgi:hypothetical protein
MNQKFRTNQKFQMNQKFQRYLMYPMCLKCQKDRGLRGHREVQFRQLDQ